MSGILTAIKLREAGLTDVVIAATGVLREPVYADIDGLENFAGACFHSAHWDHDVDLAGPNSPIGNLSPIQISELQMPYIVQLIDLIRGGLCATIAPKQAATDRFNAAIRVAMKNTVWVSGCRSWYVDKNGNPAMWP